MVTGPTGKTCAARAWRAMCAAAAMLAASGGAWAGDVDARAYAAADVVIAAARAVDGDTLALAVPGGTLRVRLHGIDAPELGQNCADAGGALYPCGADATEALRAMIGDAPVRCTPIGDVSYGRLVAHCAAGGGDVGAALVGSGLAWASPRFSDRYVPAEALARKAGVGVWQGASIMPAAWRRGARLVPVNAGSSEGCTIKGNIARSGDRIYHLPGSRDYARTRISARKGERWFCSEADARAAGWRPARG